LVDTDVSRASFVYDKNKLLETMDNRIDVSERQSERQKNFLKLKIILNHLTVIVFCEQKKFSMIILKKELF